MADAGVVRVAFHDLSRFVDVALHLCAPRSIDGFSGIILGILGILGILAEVTVDRRQPRGGSVVANGQVRQALEVGHRLSPLCLTVPARAVSNRAGAISPVTRPA